MAAKKSVKILLMMLMIICLASCAALRGTVPPPTWSIPEGIKTVEVNGYHMAYQETGSGIPFVLIHGAMSDYRTWDQQVPDFSKAYRTFAVSLRHCYPEKWNGIGDDYSVAQHAADVAAMIKKLKLGKVHLLGHSRGGSIVLTVAGLYPEVIRTLILEDGNMLSLMPETPEKQKWMSSVKAGSDSVRANLATGDREKAAREMVDSNNRPGTWEKYPDKRKQGILDNIGTALESGERGKLTCTDIQKFNFPVLLLNGEKSPKLYGGMFSAMRQCKPDIPAPLIIPNAGHNMHRDNPAPYNKMVLDFLKKQ
jgi:esterase